MAEVRSVSGGGRFEEIASYVRAKRVGPFAFVSGTTAIEPTGQLHAPYDTYSQTIYTLQRIERALAGLGVAMSDVVRTRAYLADMSTVGDFAKAHGEVFRGIQPVSTGIGVVLTTPGMMIEIEVDAVIADEV